MADVAVALMRVTDEPTSGDVALARLAATRVGYRHRGRARHPTLSVVWSTAHGPPVVVVADRPPQYASMSYASGLVAVCSGYGRRASSPRTSIRSVVATTRSTQDEHL